MSRAAHRKRVAVVGSGFGGLAAGIRLAAHGFDTVLFEARDQAGGRAYVYRDKGFVFDAGPSIITAPECIEALFSLAGRRMADYVQLLPVTPFYRVEWQDGTRFDYVNDTDTLLAQIRRFNPDDVAGYADFLAYSRSLFETGYEKLADKPFLRFADMAGQLSALAHMRADRSVYHAVARHVKDERLRQLLTFQSLLIGGNPFESSAIYAMIHYLERKWGVFFPRGGTGSLVDALVRLFRELGGELRLSSPVDRIDLRQCGGKTEHLVSSNGRTQERFDLVVSNADVHHTYAKLYRNVPSARSMKRKLERSAWTMSLIVIYFGTDRTYPDLAHHTVIFGPRYKEHLREIFHGPALPRDFSLYLHSPTVTDPSLAPP